MVTATIFYELLGRLCCFINIVKNDYFLIKTGKQFFFNSLVKFICFGAENTFVKILLKTII